MIETRKLVWGPRRIFESGPLLWVCYQRGPCFAPEGVQCDHGEHAAVPEPEPKIARGEG